MSYISKNILGAPIGGFSNFITTNISSIDPSTLDGKYINETGDTMTGDLSMKDKKLILGNLGETEFYYDETLKGAIIKADKFALLNKNSQLIYSIATGDENIFFNNKRLRGILSPTANEDAVSKSYSDTRVTDLNMNLKTLFLKALNDEDYTIKTNATYNSTDISGKDAVHINNSMRTMVKINNTTFALASNMNIVNLAPPVNDKDAVNKSYSDTRTSDLDMNQKKIYFFAKTSEKYMMRYDSVINGVRLIGDSGVSIETGDKPVLKCGNTKVSCETDFDLSGHRFHTEGTNTNNSIYHDTGIDGTVISGKTAVQLRVSTGNILTLNNNNITCRDNIQIKNIQDPSDNKDVTNKQYVDSKLPGARTHYTTFLMSDNSQTINIANNPNWYIVHITCRLGSFYQTRHILRTQSGITFAVEHMGDGRPGQASYIYQYYGEVKIDTVTDTSLKIHATYFGWSNNITTSFTTRNNNGLYGISDVLIL
jgi:hypothetical protein